MASLAAETGRPATSNARLTFRAATCPGTAPSPDIAIVDCPAVPAGDGQQQRARGTRRDLYTVTSRASYADLTPSAGRATAFSYELCRDLCDSNDACGWCVAHPLLL